jgi:hypothetical protein
VFARRPRRIRPLQIHAPLPRDLPKDTPIHTRPHILILHHAVCRPQEDVRRGPFEDLAAEADKVVDGPLGHDGAEDVALGEPVPVRGGAVFLEDLVEFLGDVTALGVEGASIGSVLRERRMLVGKKTPDVQRNMRAD